MHISCGAVIYRKNEKKETEILLLHRLKNDKWPYDSWHLPKGTQNPGESEEQTVHREIFEETGYQIKIKDQIGVLSSTYQKNNKTIHKKTIYFIGEPVKLMQNLVTEHDEMKWVPLEDAIALLSNFPIYEKEEEILEKFKEKVA